MKKLLSILAIITLTVSVFAQDQIVSPGSSYTYQTSQSVTGGISTYTWTLSGGGTGFSASTNNQQAITWGNVPGDYTVTVLETNSCSDPGSPRSFVVRVVATNIQISTIDAGPLCSDLAANDIIDVTFSKTLAAAEYPVIVTANVVSNGITSNAVTFSVASDNKLTLLGATYQFRGNASLTDRTNTITITGAVDAKGGTITAGADVVYNRQVYATPVTIGISVMP